MRKCYRTSIQKKRDCICSCYATSKSNYNPTIMSDHVRNQSVINSVSDHLGRHLLHRPLRFWMDKTDNYMRVCGTVSVRPSSRSWPYCREAANELNTGAKMAHHIQVPRRLFRLLHCHGVILPPSRCCSTHVTFDTIFGEENKKRTQKALHTVNPAYFRAVSQDSWDRSFAAILVPLCTVKGDPSLLFTLRSSRLKKHRGQVSFPGGTVDASDPDITFTALRETQEELGIDPARCEIWGHLRPLPTSVSKRRVVQPVVARITGGDIDVSKLQISHEEVEQAFTVPLHHLCNHANIGVTRFRNEQKPFTMPVYTGTPHRIWGFTAIVTHMLLSVLAPNLYTFKVIHKKALPHQPHKHSHKARDT